MTRTGLLSKPPELAEINNYLRELRAQIQNEFHQKTYLPLAGKPLAPVSPITQAIDRDPFVSPIHQVILQIMGQSYGGDSASAQIAATSRQSRVVRNILKHLDHAQAPLILLGEPGSGKTMTMQQSTLLLAERESHQVFPKIPIYVRLGEFYVTGKVDRHDVWHYVKRSVNSSISHYLDEFVREGRLVIFFDGMDEMSRERYGEHTEALSIFAASSASQSLFTCRITDFSPRFLHQRLVILPFDRSQVSEYLHKYIEQFPLLIDNRLWSLKQLTKQIIQGELPIEANNPFVLWLLCLYLQDKQVWPKSRVEMLRYYNESNYQRKIEELPDDEPHFPKPEETFSAWARFAYLTTERNRGPAMPVHLLAADQDSARVEEMIRVGKRCGVLAESREQFGEHLIRFQHHRFQEYFTALHIHQHRPSIEWLDKFDAPRWQETLLNLILMGEADDVVQTFIVSVESLTQACQAELDKQKNASDKRENQEIILTDEQQTVLADRVEVSSRILHQIGSGMFDVREKLMKPFEAAVSLLADHGNPITQVKMMRACQNVPSIDFIEALKKPLNSPINWVRNQALLLIAGNQSSSRAIGSDMATEIGYDLANGNFPKRLPTYWKAACTSNHSENWWVFLAGSFCYFAYVLSLLSVSGLLYWGMLSLGDARWIGLPDFGILNHPYSIIAFCIFITIATVTALIIKPSMLWIANIVGTMALGLLMPILYALFVGSFVELLIFICAVIIGGYCLIIGLGMAIAIPIQYGILILYLIFSYQLRKHGYTVRTILTTSWKQNNFNFMILFVALGYAICWITALWIRLWFPDFKANLWISQWMNPDLTISYNTHPALVIANIFMVISGIIMALRIIFSFAIWLSEIIIKFGWKQSLIILTTLLLLVISNYLLDYSWLFGLIVVGCVSLMLLLVYIIYMIWINDTLVEFLKNIIKIAVLVISVIAGIAALVIIYVGIRYFIYYHFHRIAYVLLFSIFLVLAIIYINLIYSSGKRFFYKMFGIRRLVPGVVTLELWKHRILYGDAIQQERLLLSTDYQSLSLRNSYEFLDLLKEIQPSIKEEPALSTYWELRYRLEEALRQERQG